MTERNVDWPMRRRYIDSLVEFMRGEMTNTKLDDVFMNEVDDSNDQDLCSVAWMVWGTYDDFHDHPIQYQTHWALYRRAIAFLLSGQPLVARRTRKHPWIPFWTIREHEPPCAPFATQRDWLESRPLLDQYSIPAVPRIAMVQGLWSLRYRKNFRAALRACTVG